MTCWCQYILGSIWFAYIHLDLHIDLLILSSTFFTAEDYVKVTQACNFMFHNYPTACSFPPNSFYLYLSPDSEIGA